MSTGYVTRIDPSTGGYEVIRAVGELVDEGMRTDLEDTYCSDTIEAGDVLAIADAEADGFEEHPSYVSFGLAAYIGGRLLVDDDGFGTICFIDDEPRPHAFTSEDKVFVELLSRWISQLYDRVYREQVITELHQVASELARCGTREEVFDVTIDVAASLLDFDRSGIAVAEQGALRIVAMSDQLALDESPTMDVEEGVAGRTFQTGESYLIVDVSRFNDVEPTLEIGSAISIPIGDIGVFQVITEVEDAFDEHDLALAELLVRHTENALVRLERERELRRQNERLEQFSSVLSHDLRNPLSVATGHVELMRESCDDPSVETAANALERMDEIIDGTLSLARRGELITRVETVELAAVARQSWATVSSGNASLDLDGDAMIRADPDRLRHVFENLFRNAVEHAGDGVTIRVGPIERSGIYIEDDGIGIGDIDTERLFEPGYSTRPEGTGFGLAIVKEVVDAHDWEIEVGSSDDGGARFELTNVRFD